MRKMLLILFFFCRALGNAQDVIINGVLENFTATEVNIYRPSKGFFWDYFKEAWITVPVKNNKFQFKINTDQPEIVSLSFDGNNKIESFRHTLFVKKGYILNLQYAARGDSIRTGVTGNGASDNYWLPIKISRNFELFNKRKDTIPNAVFNFIMRTYKDDSLSVASYIRKYKPSEDFKNVWQYQLRYQVLNDYYGFSENHKYNIQEAYARNLFAWKNLQNELFASVPLSDDNAIVAPYYQALIRIFLRRKKESLWTEAYTNKSLFLQDWYGNDTIAGGKTYMEDKENRLTQKIINRYFSGKPKEYAYAILLENALKTSDVKNMQDIYADFTKEFPKSRYRIRFQPEFSGVFDRAKTPLTDKMIFIKNGDSISTWKEVLALVKGKIVLLDMWGTWCGPCREEMENNSSAIKAHFKNKDLNYLYIANRDQGQEKKWKELIAYFNLEGYHILANEKLTRDISEKIQLQGYPTYGIIHADGRFELSKAGHPMNRQKLIEQIESALKN